MKSDSGTAAHPRIFPLLAGHVAPVAVLLLIAVLLVAGCTTTADTSSHSSPSGISPREINSSTVEDLRKTVKE